MNSFFKCLLIKLKRIFFYYLHYLFLKIILALEQNWKNNVNLYISFTQLPLMLTMSITSLSKPEINLGTVLLTTDHIQI